MKFLVARILALLFLPAPGVLVPALATSEPPVLQLNAVAPVSGDGVFLPQLFRSETPLPAVRLADAPAFGKTLILSRAQLAAILAEAAPAVSSNFAGADAVKISRRTRTFGESDALGLLTATLQKDYVKDKGQLEIRFAQPWNALVLPDEPLTLDVQDLPNAGVAPSFMIRFTLRTAHETLGTWTANLRANVWRETWVANRQLKRGEVFKTETVTRERRDVLNLRDALADFSTADDALEFAEPVPAGVILLQRMVRPRTVVHRGQRIDALLQNGALTIRIKADALQDGAPGDQIQARNATTRRELSGKVLNEKTILISL